MQKEAAQGWLERRVNSRQDVSSALVLLDFDNQLETAADWPRGEAMDAEVLDAARTAFVDRRIVNRRSNAGLVVSKPLLNDGVVVGAVAMRMIDPLKVKQSIAANDFKVPDGAPEGADAKALTAAKPSQTLTHEISTDGDLGSQTLIELFNSVIESDTLELAAVTLTSDLAARLEFDRVSIGLLEKRQIAVVGISNSADIRMNEPVIESLQDVMDETIDQGAAVVFPPSEENRTQIVLAHNEHSARHSSAQIFSFLMVSKQVVIGAIVFERRDFMPVTQEQLSLIREVAQSIGPIFDLKRDLSRTGFHRFKAKARLALAQLTSTQDRVLKCGLAALLAFALALPAVPMSYRLTVPAKLEGEFQRSLVAPSDGFLKSVFVRPGDLVKQGQVLAEMADEDFLLEKRRLESELIRHESAFGEALGKQDRGQVMSASARINEARSQLQLLEQQLGRASLVAPMDGIVTKGDLKQKLGAPVKRGEALMSVAPARGFRVILDVPDRKIDQIKLGQNGQLVVSALPKNEFPFVITRIVPVAVQRDGKNIFEVEGTIRGGSDELMRPGMEGVAKVESPELSTYERLGYHLIDWFKITFWSWSL